MKKLIIVICVFAACLPGNPVKSQVPQFGKAPVKSVVAAMTLEEKASFVVGTGMHMPGMPPAGGQGPAVGQTQDLVPGAAGTTFKIDRLGIPPMVVTDGPAGVRISPTRDNDNNTYYCTAFPVGTLLASTWDTELLFKVGQSIGNEVLEYGSDVLLGPGMNIQRNPLCGRNFEYYSEDPFVTGKIAAAMVNGVESQGVGTSIKHFAANNAETNRNALNTIVSERALREIYLEGFRIAVEEAQPWTVMSSYNLINGTYTSENYDLLTNILRKDWNFKGLVMTDWFGGKDPMAQMNAGNDLIMPGTPNQVQAIIQAVKDGKLDEKVIDRNVERIMNVMLMSPHYKGYKYSNKPDLKAHALVTRQAATEGMVLLKNSNAALPLEDSIKNLAAFGKTSYDIITGGTGSGDVNEAYSVSLVEGLQNAGYSVNANLQALYQAYLNSVKEGRPKRRGLMFFSEPTAELGMNADIVKSLANTADAALITIGRNAGEGRDRSPDEGDFQLSAAERDLISLVTKAFHEKGKKVVVILNISGVIETASWKDMPDAILLAWQGGQETGNSIADILSGKANPSGKLATTFPVKYTDNPSSKTFPGKELNPDPNEPKNAGGFMRGKPAEVTYEDGIYVGYRYFSTFKVPVSYAFGYGLSFTTFEYNNLKFSSSKFNNTLTVTVDVKNTGKTAGREVAELYLSAPAKKLDKPAIELKGFAKTRLLNPGETQTLTFTIVPHHLASFNTASSSWIAEAGTYTVQVGASSDDLKQTGTFTLGKDLVVKKETKALAPKGEITELKK